MFDDLRARLDDFATADPFTYWQRVFLCPRCAYREVPDRTCPRGHTARRCWRGDFTAAGAQRAMSTSHAVEVPA